MVLYNQKNNYIIALQYRPEKKQKCDQVFIKEKSKSNQKVQKQDGN